MTQPDPWSQLAAVAATGAPRHLAYVDGESVGYDVRMPLPALCLTCGGGDDLSRTPCHIRARTDLESRIAAHLRGERLEGVVRVGDRIALALPFCAGCRLMQKRTRRATLIARLIPVWGPVLLIATALVHTALMLVAVAAIGAAVVHRLRLAGRYQVVIESIDGDGIVRLGPIHPDTAHAIMVAAGMEPA
jgi:hypothetical protein